MTPSTDDIPLENLRKYRDKQLVEGRFSGASTTQRKIDERIGQEDQTAALEGARDRRLHAEIDDLAELKERKEDAEMFGFDRLGSEYDERIAALEAEQKDEAALEDETRAALAMPDEETLERTEAALQAADVVEAAERGQSPPQYVFDAYDLDPRDFADEYELRDELRSREPKRLKKEEDGVSTERAALSVKDRADLDHSDKTAAELIRERYELNPDDYDDVEELRAALAAQGATEIDEGNTPESRFSALSGNRKKNGSGS